MRRAPATRTGAKRGPGVRPRRSIGPEIEIAASSVAGVGRAPARTPTPRRPRAARPTAPSRAGAPRRAPRRELGGEHVVDACGPTRRTAPGRPEPAVSGSRVPDRHRRAQPGRALGGRDAHPLRAVAPVELGALAALVAHPGEHRLGRGHERVGQRVRPVRRRAGRARTALRRRGPAAGAPRARRPADARWRAAGRWPRRARPACAARRRQPPGSPRDLSTTADAAARLSHKAILRISTV